MKYLFLVFCLLISFSLFSKEKIILTSFYPMHIEAMNILKNVPNIKLVSLTKPFVGCLHDYQLTPNDMKTLSRADFFIVNGAGMESFLEKVVSAQKKLKIIEASKGITLLEGNPHVWLSVPLAIEQVRNIASQLALELPESASLLKSNSENYIKELEALDREMKDEIKKLKFKSFVTFHEAFPYLAKEYGLNISDVIEREPGTGPSAKELADIIVKLKKSPVKVIFAEPQYSPKAAGMIAKEAGARVFSLDPLVTGKYAEDAYLMGMRDNLKMLKNALGE